MANKNRHIVSLDKDPLWYKTAVIYQCHVRAFCDSDGNGIGDFLGLTSKLDYLQSLGVTALWLQPFYPSPLKDDGYDIADYCSINPIYGDLHDFREFLKQAHRRGLRVIIELVINHTSDQHPWFQRSRASKPGSRWRDYYVWSETAERYADARIIFKDFETSNWTWDPVANAYFWHRFYSHQPDLNFENPQVHKEVIRALDFWLEMGVDGLRLDAVPYLYEEEGTNGENLAKTHAYLKTLRKYVDETYGDRMLLAEANQWPEDAVAYFGDAPGDECHMAFHFPLMPRLFMALRMEDRIPIVDILEQTPAIPDTSQWALFLRNHDELTLEMVTDEERDYMYRVYARDPRTRINLGIRRRLAPLLGNDRKRIELLNALLLSLPGTPVLYYGDEIGMGENTFLGDRNGVRTPMQWSSDRNAGFSRANPHALYLPIIVEPEYHYESVNVEAHQGNPQSLLWWMKRVLAIRKNWKALGLGTMEFLQPDNRKVLSYVRRWENECILIVANLSRFTQPVELDLAAFQGMIPVEIFGRTPFPLITPQPYFLTLSPHAFCWFSLEPRAEVKPEFGEKPSSPNDLPLVTVAGRWEEILEDPRTRTKLEGCLKSYLPGRRWFRSKAKEIKSLAIETIIPVPADRPIAYLTFVEVDYVQEEPEIYMLPMAFATAEQVERLSLHYSQLFIARLEARTVGQEMLLYDATGCEGFTRMLLEAMNRNRVLHGDQGEVRASSTPALRQLLPGASSALLPVLCTAEHSNSAVFFGDKLILKLFRRIEPGVNPDLELSRFLTAKKFPHVPPLTGALEYRTRDGETAALGIMHGLVANGKDAWEHTLDALGRYYERIQSLPPDTAIHSDLSGSLLDKITEEAPLEARDMVGIFLEEAKNLGNCSAALHRVLASDAKNKDFAPEPFTSHYQRGLYQSMRNQAKRNLQALRQGVKRVPEQTAALARRVLELEPKILERFKALYEKRITAMRIRGHGDYHLGQVLHTGKEFVILDFEGEPARSLSERRIKQSPLRDVAGMLRSFHYAAYTALSRQVERGGIPPENLTQVEPWARYWYFWVSVAFLRTYLSELQRTNLLPQSASALQVLLEACLLDKAIYELSYELNNRPAWLKIPLEGILQLVEPVPRI